MSTITLFVVSSLALSTLILFIMLIRIAKIVYILIFSSIKLVLFVLMSCLFNVFYTIILFGLYLALF